MKRRLPKELTTVTITSKLVALGLVIGLPILGFFLGMRYQEALDANLADQQLLQQNYYQQPTQAIKHPTPSKQMMYK